ncbi:DNA polymerase [Eubacterium pyruvativorans]|nr:DNA polymerase [Eubacterium pyruvativorans]
MEKINTLSLDLETYSDVDLAKAGVYKYAESTNFEILLLGVSINDGPVDVYDLASGDAVPDKLVAAIASDEIIKWSFNASFERICLSSWLLRHYPEYLDNSDNDFTPCRYSIPEDTVGNYLNPLSWRCSMVLSAYNGLPQSLEQVGTVLGFDRQKLKEGKDLIRYFCVPCRPTKSNDGRTRNLPEHAPDKWELFKKYNKRDVEVEMQIHERLKKYPVPDLVWEEYHLSEEINDRGIRIDRQLVDNAIHISEITQERLSEKMKEKTGLDNPNSVMQLKNWLSAQGVETDSLGKKDVAKILPEAPETVAEVLRLRQQSSKSSIKKYVAMDTAACADDRCRGMFRFYGANRTGRFAGRIVQLQNLYRNSMPDLAEARELVRQGDYETLDMFYDNILDVLSQLIRTSFIPKPGYKYVVSDFSAIEARVLSFLAGEKWRMNVFANNGDIYCESASHMFGVPVVKHGVNGHLRQKGKIAELALGYGGSVGALKAMGALDMGLSEDELPGLVESWRNSNPHITQYWWDIDNAAKTTIKQRTTTKVGLVTFRWKSGMLFAELPSGRHLSYVKPRIRENQFGGESITYMGNDSTKHWSRIESYGPKIVENLVQAISRDILCYSMRTLSHCFIVGHVHDELIIECSPDVDCHVICEQMGRTPPWIPGLLLRADGYECQFYQKD